MKWRQKVGRTFFRSGESASARPPLSPAASASARPSSARQHSIFALPSVALTPITPHSIRNPPHLVAAVAAACTALRTMPSHRLRLASSPSRGRPDLQPPRRLPISARLIDHRPHCHPQTNQGDTLTSRRCRSPSTHLRSHVDERSDPGGRNLPSTPAAQPRASCICRCHPFPLPEGRRVPPAPPWPPPSARPSSWTPPPPPTFLMPMDGRSRCRGRLRPLAPPSSSSPPRRCRRAAVAKSPASLSPRCRRISK
jgi:hypothetical protein